MSFNVSNGLRPGSPRGVITTSILPVTHPATPLGEMADANELLRTATKQFGELEVRVEPARARIGQIPAPGLIAEAAAG